MEAVTATAVTVSPLFRCPGCGAVRAEAVRGGEAQLGAALAALRHDLRYETKMWKKASTVEQNVAGQDANIVTVCVAQVLVLASCEASTPRMRNLLMSFALGAFRNASTLVQRECASSVGARAAMQLSETVATWAGALPLLVANPHKVVALLEVTAAQVWEQREAVGANVALRRVMGVLASVFQSLAGVLDASSGDNDNVCGNEKRCCALHRVLECHMIQYNVEQKKHEAANLAALEELVATGENKNLGRVVMKEENTFPLLELHRDPLSVVLSMLSPQRVLWGIGLANRQLGRMCRDPLIWRRLFKARWPSVRCFGHLDTDPHDWLRLYINRRALSHLAATKRKQQLRWYRHNNSGHKRLAPALRPCNVCGCSKTRLYREGEAMARHLARAHGGQREGESSSLETVCGVSLSEAATKRESHGRKRRRVKVGALE